MSKARIGLRGGAAATVIGTAAAAALYRQGGPDWLLSAAVTLGTAAYHLLMRMAVGGAVDLAMHNQADPQSGWFRPRRWEPAVYQALRVKHWKGRMPTYLPELFSLRDRSPEQVAGAMCQAEVVHEIGALLSLLPLGAIRWFGPWPVFLLTSLAAAGLELALAAMQRYNRPRVIRLARLKSREKAGIGG